ncbi:MAG: bifunctional UDP-N-acetylmuramoyl-tripeptide:D-alanyl-D-alanine ligase/alanine racemase [Bacteroidales bacterium]|nr:bifunctional UDP-N-acetylmuramoyl-tripeptide:D-alanyl-D-alanine ligase/alanine racemase [Bacteroidales bacterium]
MYKISEISTILKASHDCLTDSDALVSEVCFDSRQLYDPEKTLFFAIKTARNDGHFYIDELLRRGVRNFVITEPIANYAGKSKANFIEVTDAVTAMQQLAAFHRQQFDIHVIGITGSNGKTIVKEWLAQMLADCCSIVKSPNSYNSQIGVPFSVWKMKPQHRLAIFEAGISEVGEMAKLEQIIHPTIGILTNIGEAHASFFNNKKEKLQEKLTLFTHAKILIYNKDHADEEIMEINNPSLQLISWGKAENATYRILDMVEINSSTEIKFEEGIITIPFVDQASIENATHAAVTMLFLGFGWDEVNARLARLQSIQMRMEVIEALNQSIIINDTYSLDINSLRIALQFQLSQSPFGKKCVILSDFEQIKAFNDQDYTEINNLLLSHKIDRLLTVGKGFYQHQHCFKISEQCFFENTEKILSSIRKMDFFKESILIKGARSFHFEQIVDLLRMRTHRTILQVSLPAIIHNLNFFRSKLQPQTQIVAMVKALCYGLGDAELIHEICYHNIDYLAVAYTDEGVHLRLRDIKTPIIVLGAEAHSFDMMVEYDLEPEIFNLHYLEKLEWVLENHLEIEQFKIHIKIDSGMHRLGFDEEDIDPLIQKIKSNPKLKIASVFSHLASSEDAVDDHFTKEQIRRFDIMNQRFRDAFDYPILRHILNSSGIARFPEAQMDMVRLGLGLYGFSPIQEYRVQLQHAITLKTVITQIKTVKKGDTIGYNRTFAAADDMTVAVIPIGYADGLPLALSNGAGKVVVKGEKRNILGKISMDMTVIDVTGLDVQIGDEVIVYGEENPVDEIAKSINTIPYELLTSLSKRVQRVYVME